MPLSDFVNITITEDSVGIAREGFGTAMILSHTAAWTERIRYYSGIADVVADFTVTTPEYLAASALFAQNPHPTQVAIGRANDAKPTQVYVIGAASVANLTAYSVSVVGTGVTATTVTYTSDGSATNDEIAAGLVSALNAVTGKNYTAAATGAGGSQVCTVTGNAAGNWFSLEVKSVSLLSNKQTHTGTGVDTALAAIQLENQDWYAIYTTFNSQSYCLLVAAWAEANGKIYIADSCDTTTITAAHVDSGTGDLIENLHTLNYARTAGAYHPNPSSMFGAAWMGTCLPLEPGSETWKFKSPAGVAAVVTTATHRVNLRAKKGNTVQTVAGINITWEGMVADGNFIDITRGLDWLSDDMSKGVFGVLASAKKIPFTDNGIAIIEKEVIASLDRAVARGILADDVLPVVTVPKSGDVSSNNRAIRTLPDVKWTARLAGAIHAVTIVGVVTV